MPILLPILLAAASMSAPACTTGAWVTKASGKTIFKLEIGNNSAGTIAIWTRPDHFEFDGDTFSNVDNHVVRRAVNEAHAKDDVLVLSFEDPAPNATPDILRVRCAQVGHISVTFVGSNFEPFDFVKASSDEAQLGPWDAKIAYTRRISRPTNVEMAHIFDADQADRQRKDVDWSVVGPSDDKRRRRTQELLDSGTLQSGEDFYHAAFIFQHGGKADDYLKAHLLAMVAAARGDARAIWIAAATLDRYLRAIGRPQVLGTQFMAPKGRPATQEPYDRNLISDAMRQALRVPPLAEQEKQRQDYTMHEAKSRTP
jgi:hypothetical protein